MTSTASDKGATQHSPPTPVWEIRDAGDPAGATMLVRNGALGKSLAAKLGDKPVALMRGHGTWSRT